MTPELHQFRFSHFNIFLPECPAGVPEPRAPGLRTWLARWADHPAIAWISRLYARHRGRSVERAA